MRSDFTLTRICPFCRKHHEMDLPMNEYINGLKHYHEGALLQNAFPTFTASQREFIKTGICDDCWNSL